MNARLLVLVSALLATACSGRIATPAGQECSESLRRAEKEYEATNTARPCAAAWR